MALSDAELYRLRAELGDNVLEVAASPYLGIRSVWTVIQDNLAAPSIQTTTATAVTAAGAASLVLTSATGFAAGQRVVLDVDEAREVVTVRAISVATISVLCRKTHAGTYPVTVETAETIVRGLLSDLEIARQRLDEGAVSAGLKRVDEVEWAGDRGTAAILAHSKYQRALRLELARACGVAQFYLASSGASSSFEVY